MVRPVDDGGFVKVVWNGGLDIGPGDHQVPDGDEIHQDHDGAGVIQAEIDRINGERAEYGKRKMRVDAVSAIELIQKPPMELMETLTREEQIKLLEVSDEVTESILHDWKLDWNPIATVIHFDEFGGKIASKISCKRILCHLKH